MRISANIIPQSPEGKRGVERERERLRAGGRRRGMRRGRGGGVNK